MSAFSYPLRPYIGMVHINSGSYPDRDVTLLLKLDQVSFIHEASSQGVP